MGKFIFALASILLLLADSAQAEISREILHGLQTKNASLRDPPGGDYATATDVDAAGNIYITGITNGTFSGQTNAGGYDCFLSKYNSTGTLQWTKQFGSAGEDVCMAVAADTGGTPNIWVSGYTDGTISGQTAAGGTDLFVYKFASNTGTQSLVRQFGTNRDDYAFGITIDTSQRPYLVGSTLGSLTGFTNAGGLDVFWYSLNTTGTNRTIRQFGTSSHDEGFAIAIDSSNRTFITGYTAGALSGANIGSIDVFLARYSSAGAQSWVRQFGTAGADVGIGIGAVAASGITNVVGTTTSAFSGYTNAGQGDFFIARYSVSGAQSFLVQGGSAGEDNILHSFCDTSGNTYLSGATNGAFPTFTNAGGTDAVIAKYSSTGTRTWLKQIGTSADDIFVGLNGTTAGVATAVGATMGVFPGQTDLGDEDIIAAQFSATGTQNWLRQYGTSSR